MEVNKGDVVLPGDRIKDITLSNEKEIVILGPGLRRDDDTVFVCKAGILKKREPAVYYVDSYQKRYKIHVYRCLIIMHVRRNCFYLEIGSILKLNKIQLYEIFQTLISQVCYLYIYVQHIMCYLCIYVHLCICIYIIPNINLIFK